MLWLRHCVVFCFLFIWSAIDSQPPPQQYKTKNQKEEKKYNKRTRKRKVPASFGPPDINACWLDCWCMLFGCCCKVAEATLLRPGAWTPRPRPAWEETDEFWELNWTHNWMSKQLHQSYQKNPKNTDSEHFHSTKYPH